MLSKSAARSLVAAVAGPFGHYDNRKSWLAEAARKSRVSFRTLRSIWDGSINKENHLAVLRLRQIAATRAETLSLRYQKIAAAMEQIDPDFYSADIIALIHAAHALASARNSLDMPSTGTGSGKDRP